MLHWHAGMTTGVPELDYHHRQIIDRFNDFSACTALGESERCAEAGRILDFLQFYAQWHFKREETYMEKYGCPAHEENRRAHVDFLKRFGALYEEWQTRGMNPALGNDTFATLMEWILNHIRGVDTRLYPYVPKPQGGSGV